MKYRNILVWLIMSLSIILVGCDTSEKEEIANITQITVNLFTSVNLDIRDIQLEKLKTGERTDYNLMLTSDKYADISDEGKILLLHELEKFQINDEVFYVEPMIISQGYTFSINYREDLIRDGEVYLPKVTSTIDSSNLPSPVPTNTPKPLATRDNRSPYEQCMQSGAGIRYVIIANNVDEVSITLQNDSGGIVQTDYQGSFCKDYSGFSSGDFVYISAQITEPTSGAGTISCRIYQGINLIAEGNASGFASIATCSTTKP